MTDSMKAWHLLNVSVDSIDSVMAVEGARFLEGGEVEARIFSPEEEPFASLAK